MDTAQREGTRLQSPSVSHKRLPPCSCDPEITIHCRAYMDGREFPLQNSKDSSPSLVDELNLGGTTSTLVPLRTSVFFVVSAPHNLSVTIKDNNG